MKYKTIDIKNDRFEFRHIPNTIWNYIKELRSDHLANGGDPTEFPKWLSNQGIRMEAFGVLEVSDEVMSFIELKYSTK